MKYKEGDKLVCRKKKRFFFSKDKDLTFTNGKVYEIMGLNKNGVDEKYYITEPDGKSEYAFSMPKVNVLYIIDDQGYIRFLDLTVNINIFLTESELRKEKLKKINKKVK